MSHLSGQSYSSQCLLACALPREARALQSLETEWNLRLVTTGMGGSRTAARLRAELESRRPDLIVFTGVAGALASELTLGQVVLPRAWSLEDGRRFSGAPELLEKIERYQGLVADLGLTVSRPVLRPQTRTRLHRQTGALICDMEAARALEIAQQFHVPAIALKVVSDTFESGILDFWRELDRNLFALRLHLADLFADLNLSRLV